MTPPIVLKDIKVTNAAIIPENAVVNPTARIVPLKRAKDPPPAAEPHSMRVQLRNGEFFEMPVHHIRGMWAVHRYTELVTADTGASCLEEANGWVVTHIPTSRVAAWLPDEAMAVGTAVGLHQAFPPSNEVSREFLTAVWDHLRARGCIPSGGRDPRTNDLPAAKDGSVVNKVEVKHG